MKNLLFIMCILFVSLAFASSDVNAQTIEFQQAPNNSSYNVLVRTDDKTASQVYGEFIANGVSPQIAGLASMGALNQSHSNQYEAMRSNGGTGTPSIKTSPMTCAYGISAIAFYSVAGSTTVSSFTSNVQDFNQSAVCIPFPAGSGCSYTHLAGGHPSTIILRHEAWGFLAEYDTPGFATCGLLF